MIKGLVDHVAADMLFAGRPTPHHHVSQQHCVRYCNLKQPAYNALVVLLNAQAIEIQVCVSFLPQLSLPAYDEN